MAELADFIVENSEKEGIGSGAGSKVSTVLALRVMTQVCQLHLSQLKVLERLLLDASVDRFSHRPAIFANVEFRHSCPSLSVLGGLMKPPACKACGGI